MSPHNFIYISYQEMIRALLCYYNDINSLFKISEVIINVNVRLRVMKNVKQAFLESRNGKLLKNDKLCNNLVRRVPLNNS